MPELFADVVQWQNIAFVKQKREFDSHHRLQMKIEKLKEQDAAAVSKLFKEVVGNTPYYSPRSKRDEFAARTPEKIVQRLKNKKVIYLVAKEGDRLVGFVFGNVNLGLADLGWLGVSRDYRRKGVAEQLVRSFESYSRKQKAHKVWLDTRTNNKGSIALFKKLKYKKVATLKKHFWGLDFFIWEKLL